MNDLTKSEIVLFTLLTIVLVIGFLGKVNIFLVLSVFGVINYPFLFSLVCRSFCKKELKFTDKIYYLDIVLNLLLGLILICLLRFPLKFGELIPQKELTKYFIKLFVFYTIMSSMNIIYFWFVWRNIKKND